MKISDLIGALDKIHTQLGDVEVGMLDCEFDIYIPIDAVFEARRRRRGVAHHSDDDEDLGEIFAAIAPHTV